MALGPTWKKEIIINLKNDDETIFAIFIEVFLFSHYDSPSIVVSILLTKIIN